MHPLAQKADYATLCVCVCLYVCVCCVLCVCVCVCVCVCMYVLGCVFEFVSMIMHAVPANADITVFKMQNLQIYNFNVCKLCHHALTKIVYTLLFDYELWSIIKNNITKLNIRGTKDYF